MKLFARFARVVVSNLVTVRADAVKAGDRLAPGRYQSYGMSNVHRRGETVVEVSRDTKGLIYVVGAKPGWSWTLLADEMVRLDAPSQLG